jgi:hypothetical protein
LVTAVFWSLMFLTPVAGATLAAAALFGPLRSRVQHRVDHRFNRARYDAERMLAAFAARLTEELDADAVTGDLARSVHAALQPAHVSVWLSERRLACVSCASSTSPARSAEPPGLDPAQLVEHNSYFNPSGLSGFGAVNTPAPESWWTPHTRACNAYQGCPRCLCPTRGGLHDG